MTRKNLINQLHKTYLAQTSQNLLTDSRDGQSYTWQEFFTIGQNAGKFLHEQQIDKVAIILKNSVDLLALYMGALLEGVCIIPIDPVKGKAEIEEILSEGKCETLITSTSLKISDLAGVKLYHIEQIRANFYHLNKEFNPQRILDIDGNKLYSITFTSGTSGKPKGVMHSINNLLGAGRDFADAMGFNNQHRFYHNLPMTYMAGMLNLFWMPISIGASIVIGNRFSVMETLRFWKPIIKYNVNAFFFIPTIISLLMKVDKGEKGVEYCRKTAITAGIGTAPLDQNLRHSFTEKYGVELYESYGLSETLFISTNSKLNDRIKGVGKIVNNIDCRFAEDGEIQIKNLWNFLGYYNLDTEAFYQGEYFTTGDLGFLEEGYLTINGRKKDLIIRGGVNISPARIERTLQQSGELKEFVIAGVKDDVTGEKTVCFYINETPLEKDQQKNINRLLGSELGKDYLVDDFMLIKELPRNTNGKVDKKRLQNNYKNK